MENRQTISVIELRDHIPTSDHQLIDHTPHSPIKTVPNFFQSYCLCLNHKVEPDDVNEWTTTKYETENHTNSSPTTVIPITIDPSMQVFVIFSIFHNNISLKLPSFLWVSIAFHDNYLNFPPYTQYISKANIVCQYYMKMEFLAC